ncbi:MAG: hypothetical protein BWY31_02912 [Lentisphaerae bacterium ADurb.Bin242]|nr:MAG: hypothetical protein BWY31_02912 [Lentisphaerae bacterium ADurb.Bin242]
MKQLQASIQTFVQTLPQSRKRVHLLLGILLLTALLPRVYLLAKVSEKDFLHNDGGEYMEISRQLSQGNGFSLSFYRWYEFPRPGQKDMLHKDLSRPPLFPLLGSLVFFLPVNPLFWAKGISLLLSLTAIYCVFLLGKEFAGAVCGLFSAALFSIYPYALYYTISWSTENLFLILLALSFTFLLKACRGNPSSFPYCGLFLALASLTRPTALPLAFAFIVIWVFFSYKSGSWRVMGKQAALFLGIFLLLLLPWTIRNYRVGGKFTPMTYYGSYAFWLSSSDVIYETYRTMDTPDYEKKTGELWNRLHAERLAELKEKGAYDIAEASRWWKQWGLDYIRQNPDKMAYIWKERFFHYWRMCPNLASLSTTQIVLLRTFFTCLFILALAGLFLLRKRKETLILLFPPLFGLVISIPFLFVLRYRYPFFAPYVCVFAAFVLTWLTRKAVGEELPEPFSTGEKGLIPSRK